MKAPLVVGIGEALWDEFPEGAKIGGAPLNFVFHCNQLGARGCLVSSVGNDNKGKALLAGIQKLGIDTSYIHQHPSKSTGTVKVTVMSGLPSYEITQEVAWDYLPDNENVLNLIAEADVINFSTLSQRTPQGHQTIQKLISASRTEAIRLFDFNLRQSFYTEEIILKNIEKATVLKINEDEIQMLSKIFAPRKKYTLELGQKVILGLFDRFPLKMVALTLGERGSELYTAKDSHFTPPRRLEIGDTVGAGDSFCAGLVLGMLANLPLEKIAQLATEISSFVVTQQGATPQLPDELKKQISARLNFPEGKRDQSLKLTKNSDFYSASAQPLSSETKKEM